ncbi:DUF58 domain-containing protein [Nocardioides sp. MH1]|uniref:DUF58 domain-containing protein n=1 Tax=Nocardioides sp. MH1 TaxID=3242490 RepID=UPI003521CA70
MSLAAPVTGWIRRVPRPPLPAVGQWVTPAGWVAGAGAGAGLVLGGIEGWLELRVLGLTFLLLLVAAGAWLLGRTSYDVVFDLHRERVTAGETAGGRVVIRNRAGRSLFPTRIEMVVGKGRAQFTLPSLGRDEEHEQLFEIPTRRRGVITIGPVSSVRSDPLGLLRRTQTWARSTDLYVHPVTVPLSNDSTGFLRDIEGVTTQELSSNDVSFHALREYQPGDDRRAIHWRTTARVGRLMVRQFEETRRAHLLVVLPTGAADYATEDDLESAISIAGSLARHAFGLDREVSIHTTSGALSCTSGPLVLDRLAELEPAERTVPVRDLAARAIAASPQASVAVLVTGSEVDARDLRGAHRALPVSVPSFGLRCGRELTLTQRRLGDLTITDLPDVYALPRAMRSMR